MPGRAAHLAIYTLTPLGQPTGSPALPVVPARLRHRADQAYALQGDAGATGDPCYQGRRKSHLRAAAATSTPADLRVVEPALPSEKGRYRAVNSRRHFNSMMNDREPGLRNDAFSSIICCAGPFLRLLRRLPQSALPEPSQAPSQSDTGVPIAYWRSLASPKVFRIPHPGGSSSLIRSTIDKLLGCNAVFLSQISTFHASCWTVMKAQRKCNVGWFDMVVAAIAPAARRMITQTEKGAKSVLQTIGQPLVMTLVSAASARKMPIATVNRKTSRSRLHSAPRLPAATAAASVSRRVLPSSTLHHRNHGATPQRIPSSTTLLCLNLVGLLRHKAVAISKQAAHHTRGSGGLSPSRADPAVSPPPMRADPSAAMTGGTDPVASPPRADPAASPPCSSDDDGGGFRRDGDGDFGTTTSAASATWGFSEGVKGLPIGQVRDNVVGPTCAEARLARAMAQALPAARSNSPIIATTRLLAIAVAAASQCRCCDGGFLGPAPSSEIIASTRLLAIAVAAAMGYR
uniref:Uncharacterized protein n=1 Tax=Oryza sativa subsp. japonica TaxID=39947 RepID=Q8H582_ORYSJ|nr:hypothetical protein [Oryza sativa Japonica Group]BAD30795.1 hypothetical protein [Oryza sativa Japonica Group]